jgi:hypothetical protein
MARNRVSSRPPMLSSFGGSHRPLIVRSLAAAGVGVAAKILGLINQIVSVALISGALGADGLQEQLLAIASVSWFSLTSCGLHTALPVILIRSGANTEAFALIAKAAYLFAAIGAFAALGLTLLVLNLGFSGGKASAIIAAAAICNAGIVVLSLSERDFQATDRIAQFNVLNMAGTLTSLAATWFLARSNGTATGFVVAFYISMLLPFLIGTLVVAPRLMLTPNPSYQDFIISARRFIRVGAFGFGYELAAYCKLQAPLTLLGVLGLSDEIAPVGLGLRLIGFISGGLSIVVPILLLRVGTAIHARDRDAERLWTRLGIAGAGAVAVATAGLFISFGEIIYRTWTGGVVALHQGDLVALAAFSALSLAQNLLFPLAAPDPAIAGRLRWLFWLEGPAVLAAGAAGALVAPSAYAGAGMLAGAALVMGITILIVLAFLARR